MLLEGSSPPPGAISPTTEKATGFTKEAEEEKAASVGPDAQGSVASSSGSAGSFLPNSGHSPQMLGLSSWQGELPLNPVLHSPVHSPPPTPHVQYAQHLPSFNSLGSLQIQGCQF